MSIVVQCPHCETRFNLQADMNGKSMRCPNLECRQVFTVKALEEKGPAPTYERPPEPAAPREPVEKTAHVKALEDELRQRLALKVEIRVKAKDKGQIVIAFESNDDFERIIQALQK